MTSAIGTLQRVEGIHLLLRLVEPTDASYIHGLRMSPTFNAHLSPVSGSVDDQRAWIERYKAREAAGAEYYYVIERRDDGRRCGLLRLYDIDEETFSWGSWILDENKPRKAALESAILLYNVGFNILGKIESKFDVRRDNCKALSFHRRFGATEIDIDAKNIYFKYGYDKFTVDRYDFLNILRGM